MSINIGVNTPEREKTKMEEKKFTDLIKNGIVDEKLYNEREELDKKSERTPKEEERLNYLKENIDNIATEKGKEYFKAVREAYSRGEIHQPLKVEFRKGEPDATKLTKGEWKQLQYRHQCDMWEFAQHIFNELYVTRKILEKIAEKQEIDIIEILKEIEPKE
jgi:hypothetical protein